jgi:hypothetical protein
MYAAIDGRRTIAEIAGDENDGDTRDFFERLWWYDQIVFDTSKAQ